MFEDLSVLFSWQTVVLCLAIYAIVFAFRKILEVIPKINLASKIWWRDGVLPTIPIAVGALLGWIPQVANLCPPEIGANTVNRIIFGCVAGLFSGFLYQKIMSLVTSIKLNALTNSEGATETTVSTTITSPPAVTTETTTVAPPVY